MKIKEDLLEIVIDAVLLANSTKDTSDIIKKPINFDITGIGDVLIKFSTK